MANPGENNINSWLDGTIVALVQKYDSLGLRASGSYAQSLEKFIEFREGGARLGIKAAAHARYMEEGTVAQSNPSPEKAKKIYPLILKWIADKGLGFSNQRAFAIALKIVYSGTRVPNKYNSGGVVSSVITEQRIGVLLKSLGLVFQREIRSDIIKAFK